MAAGLGPLGNQHVGAGIERLTCHALVLHLADQARTGRLDLRCKGFWIAEREHDRARPDSERDVE
jgi:hypothetical protein